MPAVRPYAPADLLRLQAALAEWIREAGPLGYCHVGEIPHRIYDNLAGRGPVAGLVQVWETGSAVVGFAVNGRFDRAFDCFAAPTLRGTDAELEMLRAAAAVTRALVDRLGSEDRSVLTDACAGDAVRAAQLARLDFEHFRLWDYLVELDLSEPVVTAPPPRGFTVRSATIGDAPGLANIRNDAFDGSWTPDAYRAQLLASPGCAPEREIVVVAPDGTIAAFTDVWIDAVNRVGHFEPVATHRDFRRRGLARVAMVEGLCRLRSLGMRTATVEYDAENTAAHGLYASLGFTRKFEIVGYRRA